jgi:ribonuclease Y
MEIVAIVLAVAGIGVGFGANTLLAKRRVGTAEDQAKSELDKAKRDADKLVVAAREEAAKIKADAHKEDQEHRRELKDLEQRLVAREESLDNKLDNLDKRTEHLRKSEDEAERLKDEIREIRARQQEKLEKVAGLSKAEAAEKLMQMTERDIKNDLTGLIAKLQNEAREIADEQAGLIITTAMERMARSHGRAHCRQRQAGRRGDEGPHHW